MELTLNQIIALFRDLADRHQMVNDFGYGKSYNIGASTQMRFPYIWVENDSIQIIKSVNGLKEKIYSFNIYCMDKIDMGDVLNYDEIISDTDYILDTYIQEISQEPIYVSNRISIDGDIVFTPVVEATDDNVNGWMISLRLRVPIFKTPCNSPITPKTI